MNPRTAQLLTAALGVLLIVVVGATIFVLLSRPSEPVGPTPTPSDSGFAVGTPSLTPTPLLTPSPTASPSPTLAPTASPSPSALPTDSPSPTPSLEPTASPSPTPSPTAAPSPSPSPTPAPTIVPTAPGRQFAIVDVGLDGNTAEFPSERFVSFRADGPSVLRARLSEVPSGTTVRLCLFRNAVDDERDCDRLRNGVIERTVTDAGSSDWTVSMLGIDSAPRVTLTVEFNALTPSIELRSFRYNGTNDNSYNGFLAQVPASAGGPLRLEADFEGGSFTYNLLMGTVGGAALRDETGGPSESIDASETVTAGESYRVSVRSPDATVASQTSVFIHATISWP